MFLPSFRGNASTTEISKAKKTSDLISKKLDAVLKKID